MHLKGPFVRAPENRVRVHIDLSADCQGAHVESLWSKIVVDVAGIFKIFQTSLMSIPIK